MASDFPWKDAPDVIACNLALGDLVNNLPRRLTVEGRVHAETLLASIGAIAGFAAQRAFFAESVENEGRAAREIKIAMTASGVKYFFGEPLNRTLFPTTEAEAGLRLWSVAAGGAIAAGLNASELPKLENMFKHVSQTLGGELEGLPSLSNHRPQAPARELLPQFWPLAMMCFNGELSGTVAKSGAVSQRWRPIIAAYAANTFIRKVQSVLGPANAIVIVMETAIYTSKLDPAVIEKA